ncbi:MAG: hypothetical protein ACLTBV_18105 [Enterocloster bolteae]
MADGREPAVPGQLELSFPPTENEKSRKPLLGGPLYHGQFRGTAPAGEWLSARTRTWQEGRWNG